MQDNEERYRRLIELSFDGIAISIEGKIVFINPSGAKLLGAASPEQIIGRSVVDFIHPDHRETAEDRIQQLRGAGKAAPLIEEKFVRLDGTEVDVEVMAIPITYQNKPAMQSVFRDITERVRVEEALRESEERYRQSVENSPNPIFSINGEGVIQTWNRSCEKILQYGAAEIVGQVYCELLWDPQDRPVVDAMVAQVLQGRPISNVDLVYRCKDGTQRSTVSRLYPLLDREGGVEGCVFANTDITERARAEEARRASERRFRAIFETAGVGVALSDLQGNLIQTNPAFREMLGYTEEELRQKSFLQLTHPDDIDREEERFREAILGQAPPHFRSEKRYVRQDGQIIWGRLTASFINDDQGVPLYGLGIVENITERVQAEEALRERAARMELISRVGKRTTAFLELDELLHQAVNLIADTFDYYNVAILLVEGNEIVLKAATLPYAQSFKERIRLRIGEGITGWVAGSGEPLLAPDVSLETRYHLILKETEAKSELAVPIKLKGIVIGVLDVQSIERDAFSQVDLFALQTMADQMAIAIENAQLYAETQRRLQEQIALREAGAAFSSTLDRKAILDRIAEQMSRAVDATSAYISGFEAETMTSIVLAEYISPQASALEQVSDLGATYAEMDRDFLETMLAGRHSLADIDDPQLPENERAIMQQYGAQTVLYIPLRVRDQTIGFAEVWESRQRREFTPEEIALCQGIAQQAAIAMENARLYEQAQQEIATRERAERLLQSSLEELKRTQTQLIQAQKMEAIGRLAGGVAHDFNNLLTAITGYASLLLSESGVDDPARADLEEIKKAADRAASLTDQLLAFSRKKMLQPKVLDLNAVVADVERMLRRLIGEDIDLVTLLDPALGRVKADPGQIQQVVMNLAVNARDAMPQGGQLTLETTNVDLDEAHAQQHVDLQPGPYVMLAVSDTGMGMNKETQDHLFEPFFTTKEIGKGTGLGLATIYGIVKQSGGGIYVYSEPGQGTTFKIYLPRIEGAADLPRPDAARIRLPQGSETVLLVEDEDMVRELARRILQRSGYTVLEARQARDAIAICARHETPIQLLITDVVMPGGMSGRDLAEHLATSRPEMQVLYISGYTDDAIVRHGMLDEGVAFLQKPFTPDALARKVRQVLDVSRQE